MALPQQVLESLTREPPKTPGWSFGMLVFSGGMLVLIALLIYFGLTLGYDQYLNQKISDLNTQIDATAKSISPSDEANLITLYSEIVNLKSVLQNHVVFSGVLSWLEKDTEANITYSQFGFSNTNQISLVGTAPTEADVNEQAAIFEAAPEVKSVNISNITYSPQAGRWQFNAVLTMNKLSHATQ